MPGYKDMLNRRRQQIDNATGYGSEPASQEDPILKQNRQFKERQRKDKMKKLPPLSKHYDPADYP